jgi:hypothetical protein
MGAVLVQLSDPPRSGGGGRLRVEPIERAAAQEALVAIVFDIGEGMGEFVYRMAPIEQI